jgi:glycosyltransferase involved in cell wall biosynthesis
MAHCTREKGLFEAAQGVLRAHEKLVADQSPISIKLQVAGEFLNKDEKKEFESLYTRNGQSIIELLGFVSGDQKRQLLTESDLFCFPSHLESFGLVLAEAMAFGLPIVTTRCGALPEVMSGDYPGLVDVSEPEQVADSILRILAEEPFENLRQRFQTRFTMEKHLENLASALHSLETGPPLSDPTPKIAGSPA